VQDRVGFTTILLERLDRFSRWLYDRFDITALRFALDLFHDWQRPRTRTDHQAAALPVYVLVD